MHLKILVSHTLLQNCSVLYQVKTFNILKIYDPNILGNLGITIFSFFAVENKIFSSNLNFVIWKIIVLFIL